jgi:hypothetical protein
VRHDWGGFPQRRCVVGSFDGDWDHIAGLITNGTVPFALARYGDGERALIAGQPIGQEMQAWTVDKFWSPGGATQLGADLADSLTGHYGQDFYYGFASPYDDGAALEWYLRRVEAGCGWLTYANLFVNVHYGRTRDLVASLLLPQLTRCSVMVLNHASLAGFRRQFDPDGRVPGLAVPDNAAFSWSGDTRQALLDNATALARAHTGCLFWVSAGPMAKPLIAAMWRAHPGNQYVDWGSSVDEIFKLTPTRAYQQGGSAYAHQTDPDWTVDRMDRPALALFDWLGR